MATINSIAGKEGLILVDNAHRKQRNTVIFGRVNPAGHYPCFHMVVGFGKAADLQTTLSVEPSA